ncbi:DUF58 domain-containing protein [Novipirellula artificiosorum]|uniref:DUF58 domain-containing protein n=1 Tax=Novipirellula artificiosorum TaxID=2528016 RepID=A0A5C6DB25_9BACT|nr:DUF58 domain-containing protein [Novipirellula artificiosorum]TWU34373.1 hypothetical protein Poly41_45200 [Novipirellula artificiosorum]
MTATDSGRPSFAVLAGVCALLLAGMLFGASLWVLAAIAAAILLVANAYLAKTWSTSVVAVRSSGDVELKIGSRVDVQINLTNHSRLPVLWVLVEDLLPHRATMFTPPALAVDGDRIQVIMLWAGQTKALSYQMTCNRRGYFQIGPTVLETGDLMGLYRRYRVGTQPQYITVLPKIVALSTYEVGSRRPIGEIRMRENVMDDPTRLRGIRRYQPGDPMRSVHWAATARTGVLHSKIYEPSSIAGATLLLDLHIDTNPRIQEPVRSDLAITAAASIAYALHDAGEPFGLATNGRDAADRIRTEGWVGDYRVRDEVTSAASMQSESDRLRPILQPASRGPVALREMVGTLARLERTDGLTLPELLTESESKISSETTVLIILQQCPEASLASILGLAKRGWAVAVIINTHDINDYSAMAGPMIAGRIPTFHLASEEAIMDVCRQTLTR